MDNNLSALEEFDAQRKIQFPYLLQKGNDLSVKKNIAYNILAKGIDEILLVSPSGYAESSVIAGLSEKNIEHFAKFAPLEYKKNLQGVVIDKNQSSEIFEISKAMDDDLGGGITKNQKRVKNVYQYISDNWTVFQF